MINNAIIQTVENEPILCNITFSGFTLSEYIYYYDDTGFRSRRNVMAARTYKAICPSLVVLCGEQCDEPTISGEAIIVRSATGGSSSNNYSVIRVEGDCSIVV